VFYTFAFVSLITYILVFRNAQIWNHVSSFACLISVNIKVYLQQMTSCFTIHEIETAVNFQLSGGPTTL